MEGETKTARIVQNSTFFIYLFFSKNSGYKKNQKHQFLKGDRIKNFWIKC